MSNLIDLFKTVKLDTNKLAGDQNFFNNPEEITELNKSQNKFLSNVDYSNPEKFAKFGSAEEYYRNAYNYINNDYPYDGNTVEKTSWVNSLTELEYHIFNNEYPRYKGYINLSSSQYVDIYSHIKDTNLSASAVYFSGSRYTNSTYVDLDDGITFESWIKIPTGSATTDVFKISGVSGSGGSISNVDLFTISCQNNKFYITDGITSISHSYTVKDNMWEHFAFHISTTNIKLYVNGQLNESISDINIGPTEKKYKFVPLGLFIVKLSSLVPSSTPYQKNSVFKLGGNGEIAFDESRFWASSRSPQKIGRNWFTAIDGNDFDDENNSSLIFYYKYNEGWDSTYMQLCLDSSGRKNDGLIKYYSLYPGCRVANSAIDESGIVRDLEKADPIVAGSISNSQVLLDAYNTKIQEGKDYDELNMHALYKKFPSWIIEEEETNGTKHLKSIIQIISSYFDDLYNKIGEIALYKHQKHVDSLDKVYPFYDKIISSAGFDLKELFTNLDIVEKVASRSDTDIYDENIGKVKNAILQNIYNNLAYILKSKGTEKSVKGFLRAYGISEELVRLNLYADKSAYQIADRSRETTINKKVANLTGSNNIYASSSVIPSASIKDAYTLEMSFMLPSTQKSNGYPSSSLLGVYSTSSTFAIADTNKLQIYGFVQKNEESGSILCFATGSTNQIFASSSAYYDLYDDTIWNLAVRLKPNVDSVQYTPATYEYLLDVYAVNSNSDSINREFSGSVLIPFVSGSGSFDSLKNFYIGARNTELTGSNITPTDIKVIYVN
jgi:hypothetical protein